MARVVLPTSMKAAAGGKTIFDIEAANMQEVLARLGWFPARVTQIIRDRLKALPFDLGHVAELNSWPWMGRRRGRSP
jgi:hypothetical protein